MSDITGPYQYNNPLNNNAAKITSYLRTSTSDDSSYLSPPLPNNPLSGTVASIVETACFRSIDCTIPMEYPAALLILLGNYLFSKNTLERYESAQEKKLAGAFLAFFGLISLAYGVYAGVKQYHDSLDLQDQFDVQDYSTAVADAFVTGAVTASAFNVLANIATTRITPRITTMFDRGRDNYVRLGDDGQAQSHRSANHTSNLLQIS